MHFGLVPIFIRNSLHLVEEFALVAECCRENGLADNGKHFGLLLRIHLCENVELWVADRLEGERNVLRLHGCTRWELLGDLMVRLDQKVVREPRVLNVVHHRGQQRTDLVVRRDFLPKTCTGEHHK
uniref:Uncharacterized protein n=1 Tax=Globisporangium ultimum (strain ATCC 200006 / CBS 805.95 / DAOM BR144) TaxID=431595 RepID=K3XBL3_GLOUD